MLLNCSECPDRGEIRRIGRRSSLFGLPTGAVPIGACSRAAPHPSRGASGRAFPRANRPCVGATWCRWRVWDRLVVFTATAGGSLHAR